MTGDSSDEEIVVKSKRKRIESTPPASDNDSGAEDDDEEEYEIEYIVDSRNRKFRGKANLEFYIHWTGYDEKDRSWTDALQFKADDESVFEFYTKNPDKPGAQHFGFPQTPASAPKAEPKDVEMEPPAVSPTTTPKKTMPVIPNSSGRKLNGGDLRGFFTRMPAASGKENKVESPAKPMKAEKPVAKRTMKASSPPKKKKRKAESDESDFIVKDGSDSDEDFKSEASDALESPAEDDDGDEDHVGEFYIRYLS